MRLDEMTGSRLDVCYYLSLPEYMMLVWLLPISTRPSKVEILTRKDAEERRSGRDTASAD